MNRAKSLSENVERKREEDEKEKRHFLSCLARAHAIKNAKFPRFELNDLEIFSFPASFEVLHEAKTRAERIMCCPVSELENSLRLMTNARALNCRPQYGRETDGLLREFSVT